MTGIEYTSVYSTEKHEVLGERITMGRKRRERKRVGLTASTKLPRAYKYRCIRGEGGVAMENSRPIINFHIEIYQSVDSPRRDHSVYQRFMRGPYDAAVASRRNDAIARKIIFRLLSIIAHHTLARSYSLLVLLFVGPTSRGNWRSFQS